jgi:glycosyltransferase involved in cell wall biosynthesis
MTWNFAWQLSLSHEVWVMTDPQFREDIERYLKSRPNPNLHFAWVSLPALLDPRQSVDSEKGLRLHYVLWQRAVLKEARRLHGIHNFDLVHHVSWGTISAPPLLWRLPIPFVWGPVGGAQTAPMAFRGYFGPTWHRELFRTFRVKVMTRLPALRKAVRRTAMILSTNPETTRALKAAGATRVQPCFNVGVPEELMALAPLPKEQPEVTFLWAGRLIPLKGLSLALEALAQVERSLPVRLRVVGDGPLKEEMSSLALSLGISDRVDFVGAVPWKQMSEYYSQADAFLFTSLRDSSGTVLLEAMAYRLPVLTLDHQGAGALVQPESGIKVPVTNPEETVKALADGMCRLAHSPELRRRMGEAGWEEAQTMGWDAKAKQMTRWYEEVVARHRNGVRAVSYAAI